MKIDIKKHKFPLSVITFIILLFLYALTFGGGFEIPNAKAKNYSAGTIPALLSWDETQWQKEVDYQFFKEDELKAFLANVSSNFGKCQLQQHAFIKTQRARTPAAPLPEISIFQTLATCEKIPQALVTSMVAPVDGVYKYVGINIR